MTVTITHSTPSDSSFSATGATAWDATHTLSGLGTMAEQNANAVAITGGTAIFSYASTNSSTSTTPTLSFNGSNAPYAAGATISGSYLQHLLQNKSGTAGASTNYVLSNDLGTDSTYYGEFGMNSSVFSASTPADYFSINNGIYFSGHDGDLSYGSGNGYKTYLAWGTTGQSAHVINVTGAIGLNTNITGTTNFGTSGQAIISAGSAATPTWGDVVTPTGTQTLTNKTFTGFVETVYAATGTTPALSPTNGGIQTWTLSGSSTPTAGTWTAGASLSLQITASTNTITWSSMPVTWMGGTAPTLSTTVTTNIELWKIGSTIYGALVGLA